MDLGIITTLTRITTMNKEEIFIRIRTNWMDIPGAISVEFDNLYEDPTLAFPELETIEGLCDLMEGACEYDGILEPLELKLEIEKLGFPNVMLDEESIYL